jgi:integrase
MESESARIDRILPSDEQMLAWPDGRILRPSALTHAFKKTVRKAGLDGFRFHDLRHTHASLLLQSRVPVKIVSERLGHSSVATTMDIYAHVLPGDDAEAAEVLAAIVDTDVAKMLPSS